MGTNVEHKVVVCEHGGGLATPHCWVWMLWQGLWLSTTRHPWDDVGAPNHGNVHVWLVCGCVMPSKAVSRAAKGPTLIVYLGNIKNPK